MPTIVFPRFDFMHGRVKKKKQRVLAAVVLPRIDFMHGRLKKKKQRVLEAAVHK